jgi:hypothetical protein
MRKTTLLVALSVAIAGCGSTSHHVPSRSSAEVKATNAVRSACGPAVARKFARQIHGQGGIQIFNITRNTIRVCKSKIR